MTTNPLYCLAAIAESQIGTEEDSAHTNRGEAIRKYQAATELDGQGWPWCAAFVDWCIAEAIRRFPDHIGIRMNERPTTAAAFGLQDWANHGEHGCIVFNDPRKAARGDLIVYTFSHVGIVTGADGCGGLETVEGNANSQGGRDGFEVAHLTSRGAKPEQIRCFIRLPSKAIPV